ncbi:MAG: hypothetical protein IJ751_00380, partial [Oscillospiraceae bacterium]|nr:hypothetical protein [Oscillospiraceae bacterium]
MTEHGWNEQDRALSENLPELPPEEMVAQVTPWKRAMGRILAGMALTSVTLEVLGLQYLLPAAGMILSLLGFRTLRRENRAFAACYGITVIRTVILWATLVLNATIYPLDGQGETAQPSLTALFVGLQFASLLCFSRGLEGVKRKAGMPDAPNGARWLLLWYALVILLWLWRYSGLLLTMAMMGDNLGMIYRVFRLSGQID